jgi:two-component system nitrogen regulation response regulator NtrX
MSLKTQAKVLRALEEQVVERVGGREPRKVDVRVIAASNRNLQTLIAQGQFREDLFYRLAVIPVEVPPLRARRDDIPLLVDHFVALFCAENGKRIKTVSGEALAYFLAYDWPGNIRELRNMVERLVIMTGGDVIGPDDLPAPLRPKDAAVVGSDGQRSLKEARDGFERAYILAELRAHDWNMTRTAERLGIERSHLYRKIKTYGITPPK